jgi:hypothetical protein
MSTLSTTALVSPNCGKRSNVSHSLCAFHHGAGSPAFNHQKCGIAWGEAHPARFKVENSRQFPKAHRSRRHGRVKARLLWCQASSLRNFRRPCRGVLRVGRVSGGCASLHPRLIAGWPSGPIRYPGVALRSTPRLIAGWPSGPITEGTRLTPH